jgi:hypothetical protein
LENQGAERVGVPMEQRSTWETSGGQPKQRSVPNDAGRAQLAYRAAFEIKDNTPKAQLVTIESFNEMRQRLLDTGEMKSK